jgi:hypothetical protein
MAQVRPTTLQATDRENDPNSHQRRRNHHRPPHSHLHSLAKLIARDKAVSTFWNCTHKPSKRKVMTCYLAVAKSGSSLVYPILTCFSCRYSKSYDISISLLKNIFETRFLSKSLGKGENSFLFDRRQPWSITHDHFLSPRQYPSSTPNHFHATAVPSKYSVRHTLHFSETFL